MSILKLAVIAACLGGLALAAPASAAVIYSFSATGLTYDDGAGTVKSYDASFSLTTAVPITATGSFATDSCSISIAELVCSPTQEFNPDGFGLGFSLINFGFENADLSGSGTGFFFFDAGAFTTDGLYMTVDPGGGFGNAGIGTLTVQGAGSVDVPEPMTMALLGGALLGLGTLRRRA